MNSIENVFTIFIVEDDLWYAEILEYHLSLNPDYVIKKYTSGKECLENLHLNPNVICLDYLMPNMDGKTILNELKQTCPRVPVILISGQSDVQTAIDILHEENVYDYFVKDDDTKDRLWKSIIKIRENLQLKNEVDYLKDELGRKHDFNQVIKGNSNSIQNIFKVMRKACDNNISVSISGETGTGKELVARCVHYNSQRSKKSFTTVNMAAIPKELVESELFGHEKGSFTGAHIRRIGKFEEAHKGTLFLDEIADMDMAVQGKLLRVLQEREVTRIGNNKPFSVDVRIIVSTHKNLKEEVKKGTFRQDLYYRILGIPIILPPLRDRKEDILILTKYFSDNFCKENKKKKKIFSKEAKAKLSSYNYPGNIRELKAIVELAVVMADDDIIQMNDITFDSTVSMSDFMVEGSTLKDYNSKIIKQYLEDNNNNVALVAKKLDIGKSTLYKMIKLGVT